MAMGDRLLRLYAGSHPRPARDDDGRLAIADSRRSEALP